MMTTTNCMTAARHIVEGVMRDLEHDVIDSISYSQVIERVRTYLDCPHTNANFVLTADVATTTLRLALQDAFRME